MRLSIPQPELLKNLQTVERAVNDRTTLPILSNVLLEVNEKELVVTATDLDVGIQCRFPLVQPVERGAVTLPARKLTSIVRELQDEVVTLEAKKNHTATLSCGPSSFRIPGLPAEDFPTLPPAQSGERLIVPQWALKTLIAQTVYAMSTEEARFILNGAFLVAKQGQLTLVATDGRRLAVATTPLTSKTHQDLQAVVPAKTIRELGRLLQDEDQTEVTITPLKDNQLTFEFGHVTVVTRLIEGQFPQYDKVIPAPAKQKFTCNRPLLLNAIRRAGLMTTTASQAVLFELGGGKFVISKDSPDLGSVREEVGVTYEGEASKIAFNPEFWSDPLKALDSPDVTIEISGPERPAVVRQPGFLYLVLPMKMT